jgi:hypothetical protein
VSAGFGLAVGLAMLFMQAACGTCALSSKSDDTPVHHVYFFSMMHFYRAGLAASHVLSAGLHLL